MSELDSLTRVKTQKVYRGYQKRSHYVLKEHPIIRLSGIYLSNFDFEIGDNIEVSTEKGRIVITKVNST